MRSSPGWPVDPGRGPDPRTARAPRRWCTSRKGVSRRLDSVAVIVEWFDTLGSPVRSYRLPLASQGLSDVCPATTTPAVDERAARRRERCRGVVESAQRHRSGRSRAVVVGLGPVAGGAEPREVAVRQVDHARCRAGRGQQVRGLPHPELVDAVVGTTSHPVRNSMPSMANVESKKPRKPTQV